MDWFDTPGEVLAIFGIISVIMGALFWIIDSRLGKVLHEFKPNGGASMRDQLNRIEGKIDGHISWHMDRSES